MGAGYAPGRKQRMYLAGQRQSRLTCQVKIVNGKIDCPETMNIRQ